MAPESEHQYQVIYRQMRRHAVDKGIEDLLLIHPWVPYSLMSHYYSRGSVTLCIGSFVEAFGNVALESTACGTPCVVSRVAAHSYNLPEGIVFSSPRDDLEGAAELLESLIDTDYNTNEARAFLEEGFSFAEMLKQYEEVLTEVKVMDSLPNVYRLKLVSDDVIKIAAWCRFDSTGLYNDYEYGYVSDPRILHLLKSIRFPIKVSEAITKGFSMKDLQKAVECGVLVRQVSQNRLSCNAW